MTEHSEGLESMLQEKMSRRELFKRAGKAAAGVALATTGLSSFPDAGPQPVAAEALDGGPDESEVTIFSDDFREYMALPLSEQAGIVQANFDKLMELRSKPIRQIGEELHAKLYSDYPNTNPPRITRDLDLAIQGAEPFYQIADANDPNVPFTSIGLLQEMGQSVDRPNVAFSSLTDSLLLGITNHKFASEVGPIDIQVAHLGGFYGSEKKGRWMMPVYLGYSSEDPSVFIPPKTWIETNNEKEDVIPFNREGVDLPRVSYHATVNRLFDTIGQSVASFSLGLDYEIDAFDEAGMVRDQHGPYELFTHEFFHRSDDVNRSAYEWLKHKALFAAANSKTQETALWYYPNYSTPTRATILDIFPEASDKSAAPDLITSEDIFGKEELSIDDIASIPSAYLARIKLSESPTF